MDRIQESKIKSSTLTRSLLSARSQFGGRSLRSNGSTYCEPSSPTFYKSQERTDRTEDYLSQVEGLLNYKGAHSLPKTIQIKQNKGIFFNKIRHFSKIFNPRQKSKLVFEKLEKVNELSPEAPEAVKVLNISVKDYEKMINERISTFNVFSMPQSSASNNRPFQKKVDGIDKKASKTACKMKLMSVSDLWSKGFHGEVMNKAEHKSFKMKIQRYLHVLHREGKGNKVVSQLLLENHGPGKSEQDYHN